MAPRDETTVVRIGTRGRIVVVTQGDGPGSRLVARLEAAGIHTWVVPVVGHEPVPDTGPIDAALGRLRDFDWLVFTSARAVELVGQHPDWRRWVSQRATRPRVAAVGPLTAASLANAGVHNPLCPAESGAEHLARAIIDCEGGSLAGMSVLWPRADISRPELRDALTAARAHLVDPVVYHTVSRRPDTMAALLSEIHAGRVDAITFLSPSSARNLAAAMADATLSVLSGRTIVASVGPSTSEALRQLGAPPRVEARRRTGAGLADALITWFHSVHGVSS